MKNVQFCKPTYTHDCTKCVFVVITMDQGDPIDWYVCPGRIGAGSVVGRCSSKGSDYWSSMIEIVRDHDTRGPALWRPEGKPDTYVWSHMYIIAQWVLRRYEEQKT